MKVFHELAFDGVVRLGPDSFSFNPPDHLHLTSDPRLNELMGAVDTLHVSGYSCQVSGTSPTLTIGVQSSSDRSVWYDAPVSPLITALSLSTSGETLFQGRDDSRLSQKFAYARLVITLDGTNASGLFRVWVTGRDLSRRSATKSREHAHVPHGEHALTHGTVYAPMQQGDRLMAPGTSMPHYGGLSAAKG